VCFFVILAPTSSIMPIADLAFEHRMYLPLAAVVTAAVAGGHEGLTWLGRRQSWDPARTRRLELGLLAALVAALAALTVRRNEDYRSELSVWADVAAKRPDSARAHVNLGVAYERRGMLDEAVAEYRRALRLDPEYLSAHYNLGVAYERQGKTDEAIHEYTEELKVFYGHPLARNNLGVALLRQGRAAEAAGQLAVLVKLQPNYAPARNNLGLALFRQGFFDRAADSFRRALRLEPREPLFHGNLALALAVQGRTDEAGEEYRVALRLARQACQAAPDRAEPLDVLAAVDAMAGRFDEAVANGRRALAAAASGPPELGRRIRYRLGLYEKDLAVAALAAWGDGPSPRFVASPAAAGALAALRITLPARLDSRP
jgi:Flp pilus assembly protein TadD